MGTRRIARLPASPTARYFAAPMIPIDVLIIGEVADVSKGRSWLGSSELKTVMEKSGVVGSPSIRFAA
jgi:hypothetical protein